MSGPMTETSFFGFRDVFKLFLQRFINNIFVADKKNQSPFRVMPTQRSCLDLRDFITTAALLGYFQLSGEHKKAWRRSSFYSKTKPNGSATEIS